MEPFCHLNLVSEYIYALELVKFDNFAPSVFFLIFLNFGKNRIPNIFIQIILIFTEPKSIRYSLGILIVLKFWFTKIFIRFDKKLPNTTPISLIYFFINHLFTFHLSSFFLNDDQSNFFLRFSSLFQ